MSIILKPKSTADSAFEPLLDPLEARDVLFPIKYWDIWHHYKKEVACFWTVEADIDFSKDREHWDNRLNDDERHFLSRIIAFFAPADTVVFHANNNFCNIVTVPEAQITYSFQGTMENIHSEAYSVLIDIYITDPNERESILTNMGGLETVRAKIDWAKRWGYVDETLTFAQRLVGIAIVEGVFFQGSFCAIYWIKDKYQGLLPGLTKSNEFIARDEALHCDFACLLYSKIVNRLDVETVHGMFREAVDIECEFITEAIPVSMIGMNSSQMIQYIKSVADNVLKKLGYSALYGATNPFMFMQMIGLPARSNFFEERVSLYQRQAGAVVVDAVGEEEDYYATL